MPEWGNLDILEACGASDSGSNPGSGVHRYQPFVNTRLEVDADYVSNTLVW